MNEPALAADVRGRISLLIRERQDALAGDVAAAAGTGRTILASEDRRAFAELLLRLFAAAIDSGSLHPQAAVARDLARYASPLTTPQLVDALHATERILLDEIALDARLGTTSEAWPRAADVIRRATLDVLGAHAEQAAGRQAPLDVRDPPTT